MSVQRPRSGSWYALGYINLHHFSLSLWNKSEIMVWLYHQGHISVWRSMDPDGSWLLVTSTSVFLHHFSHCLWRMSETMVWEHYQTMQETLNCLHGVTWWNLSELKNVSLVPRQALSQHFNVAPWKRAWGKARNCKNDISLQILAQVEPIIYHPTMRPLLIQSGCIKDFQLK